MKTLTTAKQLFAIDSARGIKQTRYRRDRVLKRILTLDCLAQLGCAAANFQAVKECPSCQSARIIRVTSCGIPSKIMCHECSYKLDLLAGE